MASDLFARSLLAVTTREEAKQNFIRILKQQILGCAVYIAVLGIILGNAYRDGVLGKDLAFSMIVVVYGLLLGVVAWASVYALGRTSADLPTFFEPAHLLVFSFVVFYASGATLIIIFMPRPFLWPSIVCVLALLYLGIRDRMRFAKCLELRDSDERAIGAP